MKVNFTEIAWKDYICWQGEDKKIIKRINQLIQDTDILRISRHMGTNPTPRGNHDFLVRKDKSIGAGFAS